MANMTQQQAAEVLRRHLQWREQKEHESDIAYVGPDALTAALETAIKVMEATPPTDEQIGRIFNKYADDYVNYMHGSEPGMTRTAAIMFVREVIKLYFGGK